MRPHSQSHSHALYTYIYLSTQTPSTPDSNRETTQLRHMCRPLHAIACDCMRLVVVSCVVPQQCCAVQIHITKAALHELILQLVRQSGTHAGGPMGWSRRERTLSSPHNCVQFKVYSVRIPAYVHIMRPARGKSLRHAQKRAQTPPTAQYCGVGCVVRQAHSHDYEFADGSK